MDLFSNSPTSKRIIPESERPKMIQQAKAKDFEEQVSVLRKMLKYGFTEAEGWYWILCARYVGTETYFNQMDRDTAHFISPLYPVKGDVEVCILDRISPYSPGEGFYLFIFDPNGKSYEICLKLFPEQMEDDFKEYCWSAFRVAAAKLRQINKIKNWYDV